MFGNQLTGWDRADEFQYLSTKRPPEREEYPHPGYLEAEKYAASIVKDSYQMQILRGYLILGFEMLGSVWERDNKGRGHVCGVFEVCELCSQANKSDGASENGALDEGKIACRFAGSVI